MEEGGQFHSAAVLTTGKRMFSRAGVDVLEKKKKSCVSAEIEFRFLSGPVHRPVSMSTELYRVNTKSEVGGGERRLSRVVTYTELYLYSQNETKTKIRLSKHNRTRL